MTFLSRLFVPTQSKRLNELIGILLIASAVLMLLALASYSPLDRSLNTAANPPMGRPAHNWIGLVGAYSADLMLQSLGVAAFLLPLLLGYAGHALAALAQGGRSSAEGRRRGRSAGLCQRPAGAACHGRCAGCMPFPSKACWAACSEIC